MPVRAEQTVWEHLLPRVLLAITAALDHRVDNGYMEAYTAAVEYLDALKGLGV